jgi:hypothetical protein
MTDRIKPMKRTLALAVLVLSAMPVLAKEVLPFIEDDFAKAVAQARTKKEPIFVDAWAPW